MGDLTLDMPRRPDIAFYKKNNKVPLHEMEEGLFPFRKIGFDTCAPYPESQDGNGYIITMIDQYS